MSPGHSLLAGYCPHKLAEVKEGQRWNQPCFFYVRFTFAAEGDSLSWVHAQVKSLKGHVNVLAGGNRKPGQFDCLASQPIVRAISKWKQLKDLTSNSTHVHANDCSKMQSEHPWVHLEKHRVNQFAARLNFSCSFRGDFEPQRLGLICIHLASATMCLNMLHSASKRSQRTQWLAWQVEECTVADIVLRTQRDVLLGHTGT